MFKQCLECMATLMVVLVLVGITYDLRAAEFQPIGCEAISMGGAGVASTRGSYAPYFNPALLAKPIHSVEISLSPGIGAREVNLANQIDDLSKININDTLNSIQNLTSADLSIISSGGTVTLPNNATTTQLNQNISTIKKDLVSLSQKNGLELMPNAALATQIGHWGVGVYTIGDASAHAVIDPNRLDVIVPVTEGSQNIYVKYNQSNSTASLSNQQTYQETSLDYAINGAKSTYLQLSGLSYAEVPVSYAMIIPAIPGSFSIGGSVKFMTAETFDSKIDIDTKSSDIQSDLTDSKETSSAWGIDLGLLYSPPDINQLSFGLVGKNLNRPSFSTKEGSNIDIDPQVRTGAAYNLSDTLTLALDLDLTDNKTYTPNYDTQFLGGGLSYHPATWFSVRGGLMDNLKESDEGLIYTAGIGFGLKWFQLDLAGQAASKKGDYDGNNIPRYARVQLALVSKWN